MATGGLLPLSATVASSEVFEAFQGDSKLQALLHGHSYSGHAAGASAGVAALQIFSDANLNPALAPSGDRLQQLWRKDLVDQLSHLPAVRHVVHMGNPIKPFALEDNMLPRHPRSWARHKQGRKAGKISIAQYMWAFALFRGTAGSSGIAGLPKADY